jgi:hypothetical protein
VARSDHGCLESPASDLTSHLLPLAAEFKQSKLPLQGGEAILEKLQGLCQVLEHPG